MFKTKKFKNAAAIASWLNAYSDTGLRFTGLAHEGGEIVLLYHQTDQPAETQQEARYRLLAERIESHFNYSPETKRKLGYPKSIIPFRTVALSRIVNSVRNLKSFEGRDTAWIRETIEEMLPDIGCVVRTKAEAREEYGVKFSLVEEL